MGRALSVTLAEFRVGAVMPPNNTAELLHRGLDEHTSTDAGPCRSRFQDGYFAWTAGRQIVEERPGPPLEDTTGEDGEPFQRYAQVEGNGFGHTLFRVDVFHDAVFTARQQPYVDFDPAFYERLKSTGLKAKLRWDAEREHLENDTRPIMTQDDFR